VYIALKYPGIYDGGIRDLAVVWLPEGTEFRIHEYDGAESVEVKEEMIWLVS
jgi:hypothetical protein